MIPGPSASYGVPMTTVQPIQITFDCASPERVGRFWCEALGYVPPDPTEDGFATWEEYTLSLPEEKRDSWFGSLAPNHESCFSAGSERVYSSQVAKPSSVGSGGTYPSASHQNRPTRSGLAQSKVIWTGCTVVIGTP